MNSNQNCDCTSGCLFFIFVAMILMLIATIAIYKQIDKLIELNTPEQINLSTDKYILDLEEIKN